MSHQSQPTDAVKVSISSAIVDGKQWYFVVVEYQGLFALGSFAIFPSLRENEVKI